MMASFSSMLPTYGESVCPPWLDHPGIIVAIFMPANSYQLAPLANKGLLRAGIPYRHIAFPYNDQASVNQQLRNRRILGRLGSDKRP
jgi:hypothetical protein